MAAGFIFGAEGLPETPQDLARMRAMADAMRKRRTPQSVGEGIAALGEGIGAGLVLRQANKKEAKGREGAANAFQSIMSAMGGGAAAPATSQAPSVSYSGSIPASDMETDPVNRRVAQGFEAFGAGGDVGSRLMGDLMGDFNLSKEQAAGVVGNLAHESADFKTLQEISPVVPGSRGGYGYAQWTGPRRKQFEAWSQENGLEPNSYEANYGFLKHELQNTPEGRILDGLRGAQTADEAAKVFSQGFLRPGIPHMDSRVQRANAYQSASIAPVMPEQPALDPKTVLAQRLSKIQGRNVSANPVMEPETGPQMGVAQSPAQQPVQPTEQQQPQGRQQVAQAMQQGMDQQTLQIMDAMSNPYMPAGQKAVLGALLEQRMQANDPVRQMQLEKGRLELERMRQPQTPDSVRALQERANLAGLKPGTPEYADFMIGGGSKGVTVNNNIGESDKFYENLDKKNAETFAMLSEGGVTARGKLNQIDRLEGLLSQAPSGMEAGVKQMLGDFGIATDGLDNIQSTRALLETMVPQQRPVGSGPMSDADVKMFRNSLPRLINQPGGNELILQTMRGIAQYEMQMGEIADMVADRAITPAEGRKRIRALENPITSFRDAKPKGQGGGGAGQTKAPDGDMKPPSQIDMSDTNAVLEAARAAIAVGKSREAVIQRLKEAGIDPSGL